MDKQLIKEFIPKQIFDDLDSVKKEITKISEAVENLKKLGVNVNCTFDSKDFFANLMI